MRPLSENSGLSNATLFFAGLVTHSSSQHSEGSKVIEYDVVQSLRPVSASQRSQGRVDAECRWSAIVLGGCGTASVVDGKWSCYLDA